jgi:hypothetical protein
METPNPALKRKPQGESMHRAPRSAVARRSFASAKDGSQNIRDNNAAWVAGPSRICFSMGTSIFFLKHSRSDSSVTPATFSEKPKDEIQKNDQR